MTTSAHGNHSQPPNGGAGGPGGGTARFEEAFSIEDAERLAATFRPSWEFDEAPFAAGGGVDAADMAALANGGVNSEVRASMDSGRSQVAALHAPAPRTETHEPEVSIIIDRTITADDQTAPPAHAHVPTANIAQALPAVDARMAASVTQPRMTAPTPSRPRPRSASTTDGFEYRVKKSNKGLFVGIGIAIAAAVAVFGLRAVTGSSDEAPVVAPAPPATNPASALGASIPPPPAVADLPAAKPTSANAAKPAAAPLNIPSQPLPPAQPARTPRAPRGGGAAPPHRTPAATPKSPPKSGNGGIVRDVPF